MRTVRVLVGKLSFTAVGVGAGLILAAGSGAAAVHFTRTVASEHAINVVQAGSSHDGSVTREDSSVSGADDRVAEPVEAREPAEPEASDDSAQGSSHGTAPVRSPEPGEDRGHGASAQPGDDKGRGGSH